MTLLVSFRVPVASITWGSIAEILLNPWFTGYVIPLVLGSWLALITANIIYIRDTKARVLTELVQLHLRLGELDFETHRELDMKTTLLYQALLLIGEDLTRRCFFTYDAYLQKTYADHTEVVLDSIRKVQAHRLPHFTQQQREAFALNPGEARVPEGFAQEVRDQIRRGLMSRIDSDVNRFYLMRSDLAAVLGLQSVAKFIEKYRKQGAKPKMPVFESAPPVPGRTSNRPF